MDKNYYTILGVNKNSTPDEIKKAYRNAVKEHHPDKGGDEEKFKEVSEAYEVLSDPSKKQQFDTYGSTSKRQQSHGFDMNDIFSQFGDIFGNGGRQQQRVRKGSDLRMKVPLTLEEVITGTTKKVKYKRHDTCIPCQGKGGSDFKTCNSCNGAGSRTFTQSTPFGHVQQTSVCTTCNGDGKIVSNRCRSCNGDGTSIKEESVDVNIPAGVDNGMQLNMSGYGNYIKNGVHGDLFILIELLKHNKFVRDGSDLYTDEWISIYDAILGTKLNVPTIQGDFNINIEPGCESGKVFTSRGKGVPSIDNYGRNHGSGNLYVKVNVKIPKNLSNEEMEVFRKLKDSK
jgi:molecular chaperone DnaJ